MVGGSPSIKSHPWEESFLYISLFIITIAKFYKSDWSLACTIVYQIVAHTAKCPITKCAITRCQITKLVHCTSASSLFGFLLLLNSP